MLGEPTLFRNGYGLALSHFYSKILFFLFILQLTFWLEAVKKGICLELNFLARIIADFVTILIKFCMKIASRCPPKCFVPFFCSNWRHRASWKSAMCESSTWMRRPIQRKKNWISPSHGSNQSPKQVFWFVLTSIFEFLSDLRRSDRKACAQPRQLRHPSWTERKRFRPCAQNKKKLQNCCKILFKIIN